VSMLLIWGSADPLNPYDGGPVRRAGQTVERPSAPASWSRWGRALGCEGPPLAQTLAAGVTRQYFERCAAASSAELIRVEGLGHQWPGGETYVRVLSGPGSDALNATERIWAFFRAHGR
jgi:polyhydroxybutyrate depolymerase